MNIFRALGDGSHSIAIGFLLPFILYSKSCKGYSGKTQILYLILFISRYIDLFTNFISIYNSVMKSFFILSKAVIVYLMYWQFKDTRQKEHDTFRIEILLIPCGILAYFVNHEFSVMEVLWTFSIYLESVCIIPQLYMIKQIGIISSDQIIYLSFLGAYRALYIFNWIYRYETEYFYDVLADVGGFIQTTIYVFALIVFCFVKKDLTTNNVDDYDDDCWLIKEKEEKGSSSLTKVIHNLNINLEPGADLGFTKSKK